MRSNQRITALCAFLCIISGTHSWNLSVNSATSMLQDPNGRFIFLHGVNSIYKQFPYHPTTDNFNPNDSLSEQDFRNLQDWGFKAVRLSLNWQGFEPQQGQYNYTYLQQLRHIIKMGERYSIGVILDAHHDLYSRRFCGQGFPDWLVQATTFPAPLNVSLRYDSNRNPLKADCLKVRPFRFYLTEDYMRFSYDFFANKQGMGDKFIKMWVAVVSYFKDDPNVIGYDLLNSPSGADIWNNPYGYFGPGINNNKYLLPFYKRLLGQLRPIQANKLMMFEPSVADYFGGFYQMPDSFANKSVISYHAYCPFKNSSAQLKCNLIDYAYTSQRAANAKKLGIGALMTDFGSVSESDAGIHQIQRMLSLANENWHGWFYWQFKFNYDSTCSFDSAWNSSFYYPSGQLQSRKLKALTSPYAVAVCGTPISQWHNEQTYSLSFAPSNCAGQLTEIYLNRQYHFPHGFEVSFKPACNCKLVSYQNNYYRIVIDQAMYYSKIQVKISAKT